MQTEHAKSPIDWIAEAKAQFAVPKPAHFTNYTHCCECFEHDQTLLAHDVDSIGLAELGSPAWDPLSFCQVQGFQYYFPALVRLCLADGDEAYYIDSFLFHLLGDGPNNKLVCGFSAAQRRFVGRFLQYLFDHRAEQIERYADANALLQAMEIWGRSETTREETS